MTNEYHSGGSSSTSRSSQPATEDDRMIALMLTEEYSKLDGAIARRLSNLAPIPVVPRVNSLFPSFSDASSDHERLLQRLQVYGLFEVRVAGDGNCQFRALSDQMFKLPDHHKFVRKEVVKQLKEYKSFYEGLCTNEIQALLQENEKVGLSGEWGDHLTLQAAADRFAAKICLLTSFRDTCFIEIVPQNQAPKRELWLSFWSEVHYNSLYEIRAMPPPKPKKKYWLF